MGAPVPGPTAERGARAAMSDQGAWVAMGIRELGRLWWETTSEAEAEVPTPASPSGALLPPPKKKFLGESRGSIGHLGALWKRGLLGALWKHGLLGLLWRRRHSIALLRGWHWRAPSRSGLWRALSRSRHRRALSRSWHRRALSRGWHWAWESRGRRRACVGREQWE